MIHFEVNFCEARDKLLVLNLNDVLFKKADRYWCTKHRARWSQNENGH